MKYKFGYIAILGRPNAGKSTLVNNLVGEKVAIVSPKPQTTRNNILGIVTKENFQLVLIDTPGIHRTKNALDKYMMKSVRSAQSGANVIVYLFDATKKISDEEIEYIKKLKAKEEVPLIVVISKIDLIKQLDILPIIDKLSKVIEIDEIVPISSVKGKNLQELVDVVLKLLPESDVKNFEYDEDYYTNKSLKFIASETIREKALYFLQEEIPHGISVDIVNFEEKTNLVIIDADIICEKDSHKSIVIGKKGSMLKNIGEKARVGLENLTGKKVLLKLFVKTKKNWRESTNLLTEFGYKIDEE